MQKRDENNSDNGRGINGDSIGDDVLQLGGHAFRKVELGLDEKEVRSYIDELIRERDSLLKRQEHLSALAALAEKTVIEANSLAQQMTQKAEEQAKAEAEKIRIKAVEDAEHIVQEKKAEAKAVAEKEVETVKIQAQKQIEAMREEQINILKVDTKNLADKMRNELLTSIENVKRQVMTLSANFEQAPSVGVSVPPAVPVAVAEKPAPAIATAEKGTSFEHIPWLEVEVLPPVDIGKIMELISRLEDLPVVKTTDLLPEMPNPLIRVFLNEPSPLAELLQTLPQVKQVTKVDDFEISLDSDMPTGNKKERIQIVLGDNSKFHGKESKKNTPAQTAFK